MNKKYIALIGIFILTFLSPVQVAADSFGLNPNEPGRSSFSQVDENSISVSFAELGYSDTHLVGPLDSARRIFSIPANWLLAPGGEVVLNYDVLLTGADVGRLASGDNSYTGTVTISFNNKVIGNIRPDSTGSKTATFVIPPEAVTSIRENGQHELNIQLNAQLDCAYDIHTEIIINSTSLFILPFDFTSPELNLARLPAPFYFRNSLLPDKTFLVVSNESTPEELQSAMIVMSGFGSLVESNFDIHLVTEDQLTNEELAIGHLIFVGMPGKFSLLKDVEFPLPVQGDGFGNLPAQSNDDGVVELAHSPWNPNKIIMLVSGLNSAAIRKAAQAVGSGKMVVFQNQAVSLIQDVHELSTNLPVVEDFMLKDLGYENETISGLGVAQAVYNFNVSKEQLNSKDGFLNLVYYHSGLLDYGVSSLSVELNGQVIVGTPFTKETEQITELKVKIPRGLLRFGDNELKVLAQMEPNLSCDFSGFSEPWLLVSNQTSLHLPVNVDDVNGVGFTRIDLKNFPDMFQRQSDLGDVAFVLAEGDASGWKIAAELAYILGANSNPSISNMSAVYAGDVPEEIRKGSALIVVGKASDLPILSEINDSLPAPFDLEANTAEQRGMQIVYRIPEGVDIGYLELAASPFNPDNLILIVSGNSDAGVLLSGVALSAGNMKDQLTGVFAITNGIQVVASEGLAQFSGVDAIVPNSVPIVLTPLPSPSSENSNITRPKWLFPLLLVSAVTLFGIIAYVVVGAFRRKDNLGLDSKDSAPQRAEEEKSSDS